MHQERGKIVENERLCDGIYRMRIESPRISKESKPGQFVLLRTSSGYDPLLRRPFSLHDADSRTYELVYRLVGRGTSMLAESSVGDEIDSIGPLGNGFRLIRGEAIVAAGGIGIAPFFLLARSLIKQHTKAVLAYGAKTGSLLVDTEKFARIGVSVEVATEDGSVGSKGTCGDLLKELLSKSRFKGAYACGPPAMLREVAGLCKAHMIPSCQISVEERMACGVGACLGCSIKSADRGYLTVCKDGPVFEAGEVEI
ncbi:MAG: dihydroorotate dehydrogenase electron transfer subunit [bacterium]